MGHITEKILFSRQIYKADCGGKIADFFAVDLEERTRLNLVERTIWFRLAILVSTRR